MKRSILALSVAASLVLSLASCGSAPGGASSQQQEETHPLLVLSDDQITLDGQTVSEESDGAVALSHDIVYYVADQGTDYGEGSQADEHTAEDAVADTVVTIRKPGTYQVSGTLSTGQLAVDLGEDAKTDPTAVVTLILDGVDITCTVAPALIFYNVYECDTDWVAYSQDETQEYQASPIVDTSAAGANIILVDGSTNEIDGSHVARIYQEGTTKKLHKYDGAFYSKMSMNIDGQSEGTGVLNIKSDNEGLDSELHLTINGGIVNIQAQDDGINTNEDGVSVTTINDGTLQINAGLGDEGDGIDSNGHLVINGGNVYTMANDRSPDGGIDADGDILINGGYLVAFGTRNDAVSNDSAQEYMELFFSSTLPSGAKIALADPDGKSLFSVATQKSSQSLTFSSTELKQNTIYTLTIDGVVQQYTSNFSGGFGGGMGGNPGQMPQGGGRPDGGDAGTRPELPADASNQQSRPQGADGQEPPERPDGMGSGGMGSDSPTGGSAASGEGSTEFTLTDSVHTFSGISDSVQDSGKTQVSFSAQIHVGEDGAVTLRDIQASAALEDSHVQLSITDIPSEDYAAACLLSDGAEALEGILPTAPGTYQLTISVTGDGSYTGTALFQFTIPE